MELPAYLIADKDQILCSLPSTTSETDLKSLVSELKQKTKGVKVLHPLTVELDSTKKYTFALVHPTKGTNCLIKRKTVKELARTAVCVGLDWHIEPECLLFYYSE